MGGFMNSLTEVFLKVLDMSMAATWMMLAVALLRALLKKAPRSLICLMWALTAVRLLCPLSFRSIFSLVPSFSPTDRVIARATESVITPAAVPSPSPSPSLPAVTKAPQVAASTVNLTEILAVIWLAGVAATLICAAVSYVRLRKKVAMTAPLEGNILLCDSVSSPFILGVIRPKIYLPSDMDGEKRELVLAHERAHLARKDHLLKPAAFAALALHWFNPLCWLSYTLLCRDIEIACDERVIRDLGSDKKCAYSQALLDCSAPRRTAAACPIAFGEVGVKERVKNILNYRKPAFWLIISAVIICIAAAVCLLTDPAGVRLDKMTDFAGTDGAFDDISSITVAYEGKTFTVSDEAAVKSATDALKKIRIHKSPIDGSTPENRPSYLTVCINHGNGADTLFCFGKDLAEMYECGYFKESYSHRVVSPKEVKKFIDALAGCEVTEGGIIYGRTYYSDTIDDGKVNSTPSFKLDKDGKFEFSPGYLSSYLGIGNYRFDGVRLTLKTDDGKYVIALRAEGAAFRYYAADSSPEDVLKDGTVFN